MLLSVFYALSGSVGVMRCDLFERINVVVRGIEREIVTLRNFTICECPLTLSFLKKGKCYPEKLQSQIEGKILCIYESLK